MNAASPTLRPADEHDVPAVRALLADCGLPTHGIEACLEHCLLFEQDGRPVATGAVETCGESLLLRSMAVAAPLRGRGLASLLVTELEQRARDTGAAELWLLTDTAVEWFAARGFEPVDREHAPPGIRAHAQFHSLCPASARLMRRRLRYR